MRCTITGTESRHPFDRHYLFCVGSGHAPLALRTDYVEQLKRVHKELGIKRVRFHGIFDEDMKVVLNLKSYLPMPGTEKFRDVSFNQIGLAYDNILSAGMKPLVELSFMPALFARNKKQLGFSYKAGIAPPKNYDEWDEFIRKFIRFLLDRYGMGEVEQWYFEVWNEPNIGTFFAGTQKDYFELYAHTARAIKSVDKALQVGGASHSNQLLGQRAGGLLRCKRRSPRFLLHASVYGRTAGARCGYDEGNCKGRNGRHEANAPSSRRKYQRGHPADV